MFLLGTLDAIPFLNMGDGHLDGICSKLLRLFNLLFLILIFY